MAYSAPSTRTTGDLITAAIWNQDVVSNVTFLANPPACRVYHNTTQAVNDATTITVAFNTERFDTAAMHDTATNNSRITFGTAGIYLVSFTGLLTARTDYLAVWAGIRLNGTTSICEQYTGTNTDNVTPNAITLSTIYKFAAADYVEVRLYENNSGSANPNLLSTGNTSPEFSACWIGLG